MNVVSRVLSFAVLLLGVNSSIAQVAVMPSMFGTYYKGSVPPTIQTQYVTIADDASAITANVNITAPAGTTITSRGVCYSTSPNPTTANTKTTNSSGTGSYSASLSISSGSIYYVRGYAIAGGTTYYGNEVKAIIYVYSGGVQTFSVPAGVTSATVKVLGAAGGDSYMSSTGLSAYGGWGAAMQGVFTLTPGESIYLVVGEKGKDASYNLSYRAGGGGGGTFVYRSVSGNPMIIAGGGGGALYQSSSGITNGQPGQAGTSGTSGARTVAYPIDPGASNGNGGIGRSGGGGAGWNSAGSCDNYPTLGGQRNPWNAGAVFNTTNPYGQGGYGGGGSATQGYGGGGGGYSGGNSPYWYTLAESTNGSGGGAGSVNYGTSALGSTGTNPNNGMALITW